MSLFKNQSFVILLAKQLGIQNDLQLEASALIQALVQNETRKLLEVAIKFMTNQKRQQLIVDDFQYALKYMGIRNIYLIEGQDHYHQQQNGSLRVDVIHNNADQFIKEQLKGINHLFQQSSVKARWVYLNSTVPRIEQNVNIKSLKQINELKSKQQEQKHKKFNVIRDTPLSLLSKQQEEFFKQITLKLQEQLIPQISSTNLNHIFHFLINYLLSTKMNDTMVLFLIQVIKNKYVEKNVEIYLHQILGYLMGYGGQFSWEVGIEIANLIKKWGQKYKNLFNILIQNKSKSNESYSVKIKKLAFQIILKINMKIDTSKLERDIENEVPLAKNFLNLLNNCTRKLHYQSEYHKNLTEGLAGLQSDCFLDMHL